MLASLSGTLHVERGQHESLIGLQLNGLAAAKGSEPNLGSLQISENRRGKGPLRRDLPDQIDHLLMSGLVAMRHVQAKDVDARLP